MATLKSSQITNMDAVPAVMNKPNEQGRVRAAYWSFTTPAGGVAINDIIQLVKLPNGARIIGGRAAWEAMSTGAGAATAEIGVSGTVDKYLEATSVDAAGGADFANTVARNFGDALTAETIVQAKATVEAWAAAKKFNGYVKYVID